MSEHREDKDHGLWPQSEPSEKKSGKNPCGVCQTGVGRNASVVDACSGSTRNAVESKAPCAVIPISAVLAAYERHVPVKEVLVDDETVKAVLELCYLGDMLSAGGGCELAAVTHCKSA